MKIPCKISVLLVLLSFYFFAYAQDIFSPGVVTTFLPNQKRIIAIGDIHGDQHQLYQLLKKVKIISDSLEWIGDQTHLVQVGDVLDRGDGEREILDFLFRLKEQAKSSGGDVHLVLGNHEIMNVGFNFKFVTPYGFESFQDLYDPLKNDEILLNFPLEKRGRVEAFRPGGFYSSKLSNSPTILVIGKTAFVHGSLKPKFVEYGVDRINTEISQWFAGYSSRPNILDEEDGPVWSREFSDDQIYNSRTCKVVKQTLSKLNIDRIIVAHTVQPKINHICRKKVWRIDTGLSSYYGGRRLQALEILSSGKINILE